MMTRRPHWLNIDTTSREEDERSDERKMIRAPLLYCRGINLLTSPKKEYQNCGNSIINLLSIALLLF